LRVDLGDKISGAGLDGDQPFLVEHLQRIAHRRHTGAEPGLQVIDGQPFAGLAVPEDNFAF
jgi:hypothetical protein